MPFRPSRHTVIALAATVVLAVGWVVVGPVFFATGGPDAPERFDHGPDPRAFVDRTQAAGFDHVHSGPSLDPVLEPIMPWVASVGAAAAAGDFDGDGWVDLYVTDTRKGRPNRLYRNARDGTFVEVAASAGVAAVNDDEGVSTDCVWGDFDNDGHLDLFVVRWGRDLLLRNEGDGHFTDVSAAAFRDEEGRPGSPWANGCAALWFDHDGDGWLDLYVGNYFAPQDLWNLEHTRIMHDDFEKSRNAGRNALFRNNGDGTFTDIAAELGLDDPGWTLSVGHGDVDNDGHPDLYCANDFGTDQMFLNQGDGTFRNVTRTAFGEDTKKGMNVDFGDFDANGWLDIYVTNITTAEYLREGNMLWQNDAENEDGVPVFLDSSVDVGAADGGWGWGAKFFDFDNDGDEDIISVNGFITAGEGNYWFDLASWTVTGQDVSDALNWPPIGERSFSGREATRLWRNDGQLHFTEIAASAGIDDHRDGRGVVTFDSDNDGDLDVYIANQNAAPAYFRNDAAGGGHWLELRLVGRPEAGSNRDAIGARVTVVTGTSRQIRELDGGNSFCGQSDRRIHFGLGDRAVVELLEIRWPSRRIQRLENVRADRCLTIEEPPELPEIASLIPATRSGQMPAPRTSGSPPTTLPPAERELLLASLEEQIALRPDDPALASKYRQQCVRMDEHPRSIGFFEGLVEQHPATPNLRLQLACAYVDKIPTCGGMAAVVSKGTLARQALDQLTMVIEANGTWWPAVYARAMNHLHWPRALRHSGAAARDFRACIALQTDGGRPAGERPYHVRSYIGLGDALAKDGHFRDARAAWRQGLDAFPGNADLVERLGLSSSGAARDFVERARNLEQQIDTDFSFLLSR